MNSLVPGCGQVSQSGPQPLPLLQQHDALVIGTWVVEVTSHIL